MALCISVKLYSEAVTEYTIIGSTPVGGVITGNFNLHKETYCHIVGMEYAPF